MKWRDAAVSAIVTLVVTVLSGVALWAVTREPSPVEKLVYQSDTAAVFGEGGNRVWFINITVQNLGTSAAKQVRIVGALPQGAIISDRVISFSSGATATYSDKSTSSQLDLIIPTLVPREKTQVSLLVRRLPSRPIQVLVRSDSALGIPSSQVHDSTLSNRALALIGLGGIVFFGILLQLLLPKYILRKLRNRQRYQRVDTVSTAFMLLQRGLLDEAELLFSSILQREGGGSILLSDYGALLALKGNNDKGERYMSTAEVWARDAHSQAVCEFNRCVVYAASGDYTKAREALERAYACSSDEIDWYSQSSIYIQQAAAADSGLADVVRNKGAGESKQVQPS